MLHANNIVCINVCVCVCVGEASDPSIISA